MAAKSFNATMKARFRTITTSGDKLNTYIHETAMLIAGHAKEHGDCSMANEFVMSLPASMRREMLILWFSTFTPIVTKNDDKWVPKMQKVGTPLYVEWDLEAGDLTPFFKLAEQNKEKAPMSLEAIIKALAGYSKKIDKAIEAGEVKPEDTASLKAASIAIAGINLVRITPVTPKSENDDEEQAGKSQQAA